MNESDLSKYCDQMEEIKRRMNVVDFFLFGTGHAMYQPTTVETVYLQFRKILELIAMASLVANKKTMSQAYEGFEKSWNAELMLKDIERINQKFYPHPFIDSPSGQPNAMFEWKERGDDYLSKSEFVRLYKRCGAIMHADNPLGKKTNYPAYFSQITEWRQKILNLLNCHHVQLDESADTLYVINMKEDRDDKVHWYVFEAVAREQDRR